MAKKKVVKAKKKTSQKEVKSKSNNPDGRPSRIGEIDLVQLEKLCILGATDKQIADFFGISESTLNNYKHKSPQILESIKRGKLEADSKVADSLYQKALGYEHDHEEIHLYYGKPIRVQTRKKFAPDTLAGIFWLKNRQPELWRDKIHVDNNHSGSVKSEIDFSKLSTEALKEIIKAATKQEGE